MTGLGAIRQAAARLRSSRAWLAVRALRAGGRYLVAGARRLFAGGRSLVGAGRRLVAGAGNLTRGLGRGVHRASSVVLGFWRSVRPATRRGGALGILGIVGGAALLAAAIFVGAAVAWSPYLESVVHPDANPRAWAALDPAYAGTSTCADCHAPESAKATTARHAGIGCESCHGALLDHSLIDPGTPATDIELDVPTDEICVRCHAEAAGRPEDVRQIVVSGHYVEFCLQCHDPHTGISRRPPILLHTQVNLPPCATCHGPEGFKARNQRHPEVLDDEPCLECHAPDRGPGGD